MANEGASFVCTIQEQVLQHTISTFVHSRGLLFKSGRFPVCKCAAELQLQSAERENARPEEERGSGIQGLAAFVSSLQPSAVSLVVGSHLNNFVSPFFFP
ncbi:hypothetical protein GQ607_012199 [Colletotrichum asianum]|uniref:Uncharacterized protein n=1 Tax=Colletotrichum asianum TaxID=702518 RepID=A0A8H3ZIM7_9PEZI|nr:hypothetical protein GQ607_012199 [Colletotrichum asianum]